MNNMKTTVGFIGTGNMGSAIAVSVAKCESYRILLYDKDTDKRNALAERINGESADLGQIANSCDYIFLGVKPNILPEALKELCGCIEQNSPTLISMAAGVSISKIENALPRSMPIIRIMPNTPVTYGEGMVIYSCSSAVSRESKEIFTDFMRKTGMLKEIDESLIDAATAVSGCGPAFVYMFIEAMVTAGVECGLTREDAEALATQTLIGGATMVRNSPLTSGELVKMVCSPGGSTIEGVKVLENEGMMSTVNKAVHASFEKTKLLGK